MVQKPPCSWDRAEATGENSLKVGDQYPIVDYWDASLLGLFNAVEHLALVEHTSTAVYDEFVRVQLLGILHPTGVFKYNLFAGMLMNPAWNFNGSNIIGLPMMSAPL